MGIDIATYKRIADVPADDWDRVSTSLSTRHAFLGEVETLVPLAADPRYIVVSRDGSVIATAACYIERVAEYATLEQAVYGRLHRLFRLFALGLNPCLAGQSRLSGVLHGVEVDAPPGGREAICRLVLEAMAEIAGAEGIAQQGFVNLPADEVALSNALASAGYARKFSAFDVHFDVSWGSFDDYLHSFAHKSRYSIRRELANIERLGIKTERLAHWGGYRDDLISLFSENYSRYQGRPSKMSASFLAAVVEKFPDNVGFVVDTKNGRVVSGSMYFKWPGAMYVFKVGRDSALARNTASFFNTSVYELLKIAIASGCRKIYHGTGAYNYKVQRGASLTPMHMHVKCSSPVKQAFIRGIFPVLGRLKHRKHLRMLSRGERPKG